METQTECNNFKETKIDRSDFMETHIATWTFWLNIQKRAERQMKTEHRDYRSSCYTAYEQM